MFSDEHVALSIGLNHFVDAPRRGEMRTTPRPPYFPSLLPHSLVTLLSFRTANNNDGRPCAVPRRNRSWLVRTRTYLIASLPSFPPSFLPAAAVVHMQSAAPLLASCVLSLPQASPLPG